MKNRKVSLLFSLVLFLACFPVFMRQNGALNVIFMIPFLTLFFFLFCKEANPQRKGFYLFLASFLCAISAHVFIPTITIFYLTVLFVSALLLGFVDIKKMLSFFLSRVGFLWTLAALFVAALVCAPIIALWYDTTHYNELFPTLRFLQKNGFFLVRGYASDLAAQLASESFSNNLKTSLTVLNITGLFSEPLEWSGIPGATSSEIRMYIGLLPLSCVVGAWFLCRKDKQTWLFSVLALSVLLLSCNFKIDVVATRGFSQKLLIYLFPFFKSTEVYQNFGSLFLLCLIVVAAIGFCKILQVKSRAFLGLMLLAVLLKLPYVVAKIMWHKWGPMVHLMWHIDFSQFSHAIKQKELTALVDGLDAIRSMIRAILAPILFLVKNEFIQKNFLTLSVIIFLAAGNRYCEMLFRRVSTFLMPVERLIKPFLDWFLTGVVKPLVRFVKKFIRWCSFRRLLWLSLVALFLDLFLFNFKYGMAHYVLYDTYSKALKEERVFQTQSESEFLNYRVPFSAPGRDFTSFFGHELYHARKAAFPLVIRNTQLALYRKCEPKYAEGMSETAGRGDHFFTTNCYYDALVNIDLPKQAVAFGIASPILNYFPKGKSIFLQDKYQVIRSINESSLAALRGCIFIEREQKSNPPAFGVAGFFDPKNYLNFSLVELALYRDALTVRSEVNPDVKIQIVKYDVNRLSLSVVAPYEGFLYFGDGYSKHWKAFLDGKPIKIEKTNINFKSIPVSAGKHEVLFLYDPTFFRYSIWMYFSGLVVGFLILLGCWRETRWFFYRNKNGSCSHARSV
ncbi:MAG: YfhO family protein [Candidatus Omnitrophota bacterium]